MYEGYFIKEHQLLNIYDPRHLLKSIRNNLMTKNVTFTWCNDRHMAKWDYFVNTYKIDKPYEDLVIQNLLKITETHVHHNKIKKMKVSLASQIFSHKVTSTMRLMYDMGKYFLLLFKFNIFFFLLVLKFSSKFTL